MTAASHIPKPKVKIQKEAGLEPQHDEPSPTEAPRDHCGVPFVKVKSAAKFFLTHLEVRNCLPHPNRSLSCFTQLWAV